MDCPKCKLKARVARVEEKPDTVVTYFTCVNLRCPNNRQIIGEKVTARQTEQKR